MIFQVAWYYYGHFFAASADVLAHAGSVSNTRCGLPISHFKARVLVSVPSLFGPRIASTVVVSDTIRLLSMEIIAMYQQRERCIYNTLTSLCYGREWQRSL